jgi:hypothetical protein
MCFINWSLSLCVRATNMLQSAVRIMYNIALFYVLTYPCIWCVMLYKIMLCCVVILCHVKLRHFMLFYVMSYCVVSCRLMLFCYVMLCYVIELLLQIIVLSVALQTLFGPWPLFHIINFVHSRWDFLDGESVRHKTATYTQNNTNTMNAHREPCLEWDSNPWSQRSSERRHFMP